MQWHTFQHTLCSSQIWNPFKFTHQKLSSFKSQKVTGNVEYCVAQWTKTWMKTRIQCCLVSFKSSLVSSWLTTAIPTLYDHFPKSRSRVRSTGFSWVRWRRCQSSLIGRWRRRRRELPPENTADLGVFACESAVRYRAMKMTVMWSRGRFGYDMRFVPS